MTWLAFGRAPCDLVASFQAATAPVGESGAPWRIGRRLQVLRKHRLAAGRVRLAATPLIAIGRSGVNPKATGSGYSKYLRTLCPSVGTQAGKCPSRWDASRNL